MVSHASGAKFPHPGHARPPVLGDAPRAGFSPSHSGICGARFLRHKESGRFAYPGGTPEYR
jgi:hypothetical protein